MKQLVGPWCDGDYRRPVLIDPIGMHASNFDTMSVGQGSYTSIHTFTFLLDQPLEYKRLQDMGVLENLPTRRADQGRPVYVYDVQYIMSASFMLLSMSPNISAFFSN